MKLEPLICPNCGGGINRDRMICEYCGTKFKHDLDSQLLRIETYSQPIRAF